MRRSHFSSASSACSPVPRPSTTRYAGVPSGDDFTGLLSLLGGFLLLGIGTVTLWRTRRTDDSRHPSVCAARPASSRAVSLLIALVLFPTAIAYVVTHTARAAVPSPNLGATPEDVSFTTSDGLRLEGWFVPSRNGATVIAFPGRSGPQKHARMLVRHGYGVLLFDRRGEGASEGDPNAFGWVGDRDLHAAAAFLRSRPDVDPERIGGIGLSVGGEMLIHAAAHSDAFKAIVSEGGSGQSIRDGFANTGTLDADPRRLRGDRGHSCLHKHAAPAEPEERGRQDRPEPPSSSSTARTARAETRRSRTGASRRRRRAEADLGGAERAAHRRHHHRARRIRAPRDRLLRPDAAPSGRSVVSTLGAARPSGQAAHARSSSGLRAQPNPESLALALAVIALHIVDDNYLQPRPGTSAGDHLASGLVPVAILLVVAAAYPHLPARYVRPLR